MKHITLGFGLREVTVSLPANRLLDIVTGKDVPSITDVPKAVRDALHRPIGSPPLPQVVSPGDKVALVVSDLTRMWVRHDLFLPPLLDELNQAGVPDNDIQLVVALGAHRRHTDEENISTYGSETVRRVTIEQSYALDADDFVYLGTTSRGVPVEINRHVARADKVILTGGIVYHSMAGFSAGRKAVLPGVAGYASIQGNHSFCLHPQIGQGLNPACDSGSLDNNPMHQDQLEIAQLLNPAFLLNAVYTADGDFARFVAGHWHEAWLEGCRAVADISGVTISGQADITLVSAGGFPKDINFYQGAKSIENAYAATKPGGVIIAVMECRDINDPPDFSQWFEYSSLLDREMALREAFTVPGFVALKLGMLVRNVTVIMVTLPENAAFFAKVGMLTAGNVEEALTMADAKLGRHDAKITVMPCAAATVPLRRP